MRNKRNLAFWAFGRVQPDIYAVLTLNRSIRLSDDRWFKADPIDYDKILTNFMKRLSRRVYGEHIWRRYKKRIPNVTTLEGDGTNKHFHVNVCIRRPPHISYEEFERIFRETWLGDRWSKPDIYFEPRTGDCVSYSLKEGQGSFLPGPSSL